MEKIKSKIYLILSGLFGGIILGVMGLYRFALIGGNECDFPGKNCSCFSCNLFGLRGYESSGVFGLIAGFALGLILGMLIYKINWRGLMGRKNNL